MTGAVNEGKLKKVELFKGGSVLVPEPARDLNDKSAKTQVEGNSPLLGLGVLIETSSARNSTESLAQTCLA